MMRTLLSDLKTLMVNHWKILLLLVFVAYCIGSYSDIKHGLMDGWKNK
jgi:hypothetical protein